MPAVTTKFLDNDKLDLKTFKINIEEQLSAGVHGIVLGGSLGESSTLDESEKKTLLNQTVEIVSGRIPVIMNIAASSTKKAIESAILAERNGGVGEKENRGQGTALRHQRTSESHAQNLSICRGRLSGYGHAMNLAWGTRRKSSHRSRSCVAGARCCAQMASSMGT